MNTQNTQYHPYEIDNRERYRQMLIASQQDQAPYHYDFHGEPTGIGECIGLAIFAASMLALMAYSLMWTLG